MQRIKPLIFMVLVLATFALFAATPAVAGDPCPNTYPCGSIGNFGSFLQNGCGDCFDTIVCEDLDGFDFTGRWLITAIARESGHQNKVTWSDGIRDVSFDTADCSNWRVFEEIDFGHPLMFKDMNDNDPNVSLDPYCLEGSNGNCLDFQLCRVTENSSLLLKDDIVIGFEDSSDYDYDDIIVVARQAPPLLVTSSASDECKILGHYFDESKKVWVPVSMYLERELDGCKVKQENIVFYANNPECKPCESVLGCVVLESQSALPDPKRNYCMALDGPACNECVENESGSPQEYWYWNNGQLRYSCFDLTAPGYACPTCCYTNASCKQCP